MICYEEVQWNIENEDYNPLLQPFEFLGKENLIAVYLLFDTSSEFGKLSCWNSICREKQLQLFDVFEVDRLLV